MTTTCPLCRSYGGPVLYATEGLPVLQNRTYATLEEAQASPTGALELVQCSSCGFGYNARFDEARMTYDDAYQNEQGHSGAFREHLDDVCDIVVAAAGTGRSFLEIGCGKGTFLGLLKARGARARGFDPAYEGNDPDVVREYFRPGSTTEPADMIVLRHTLEHVARPLEFLRAIAAANQQRGRIFIEVPDFDWIAAHGAFWDLFYEHCNYFNRDTLCALFETQQWHSLFEGQYQGIVAELGSLVERVQIRAPILHSAFPHAAQRHAEILERSANVFVWGAASKGVIFCNRLDPGRGRVRGLIDINPAKQGRYIAVTGHRIHPPAYLDALQGERLTIVVANPNYLSEIRARSAHLNAEFLTL